MSARILHLHRVDGHAIGIFDQADSIVAEVGGLAGMSEDDARRFVACWNEHDGLKAEVERLKIEASLYEETCANFETEILALKALHKRREWITAIAFLTLGLIVGAQIAGAIWMQQVAA